jgi:chemotaxis signal transduction protein
VKALELREAFDAAFAAPPAGPRAGRVELLAIRVDGQAYALRLTDVAALLADRRIARLPGASPGLAGLAGHRDEVIAVFDLRALLGLGTSRPARFVAQLARDPTLGVCFDALDGCVVVDEAEVGTQRTAEGVRPLIDVDSLAARFDRRSTTTPKETRS